LPPEGNADAVAVDVGEAADAVGATIGLDVRTGVAAEVADTFADGAAVAVTWGAVVAEPA
jgi:hypothetical protein